MTVKELRDILFSVNDQDMDVVIGTDYGFYYFPIVSAGIGKRNDKSVFVIDKD